MEPGIIQQNGYTWVALPKEGILPLTLLEEQSKSLFTRIKNSLLGISDSATVIHADIFGLFPKPEVGGFPVVSEAKQSAFFKGHDILSSKVQLNLSGLEAMQTVGNADLKAKVTKAKKRLFSFNPVNYLHVDTDILLEEHLNIHRPKTKAAGFLEKLKKGKLFVVTEVLQTQEFTVRDASDFEISGKVSASAVEGYLASMNASAKRERDRADKLVYKGEKPVTFALKVSRILYDKAKNTYSLNRETLEKTRSIYKASAEEELGDVVSIE